MSGAQGPKLSAADLAAAAAKTRVSLGHSLALIDRKYAFRPVLLHLLRLNARQSVGTARLGATFLPLSLIALGIGWLGLASGTFREAAAGLKRLGAQDILRLRFPPKPRSQP